MSFAASARSATLAVAPQDTHRVSLRFQNSQFSVLGLTRVRSALPPSDALPGVAGGVSGFWFELRTASGDLRYRRILGDPVRLYFEGQRATLPGEPLILERDEQIPQSRLFTLMIPRAADGEQLVLYGSPLVAGFGEQPATELTRLTLVVPEEGTP
jgi:hypothetical protein